MTGFVLLSSVLFLPYFLGAEVDSEAEDFIEVKFGPQSQLYELDGFIVGALKENKDRRSIRKASTCVFPVENLDYVLICKLYPNRIACSQTCPFGYTFSDGIQRFMTCRHDENRWLPVPEFEMCKPFVDCGITPGPGATYKCYSYYLKKGTSCEISCHPYEDLPAVPKSKHQCDIQGKWTPKLPHCAKPGSGMRLVARPKGAQIVS